MDILVFKRLEPSKNVVFFPILRLLTASWVHFFVEVHSAFWKESTMIFSSLNYSQHTLKPGEFKTCYHQKQHGALETTSPLLLGLSLYELCKYISDHYVVLYT